MKVYKTDRAQQDLVDLWVHIAADNEAAANRLLDAIEAKLTLLESFADIGTARDDLRSGFRMLVSGPYLILYRVLANQIEIVRVADGRRDLKNFTP